MIDNIYRQVLPLIQVTSDDSCDVELYVHVTHSFHFVSFIAVFQTLTIFMFQITFNQVIVIKVIGVCAIQKYIYKVII